MFHECLSGLTKTYLLSIPAEVSVKCRCSIHYWWGRAADGGGHVMLLVVSAGLLLTLRFPGGALWVLPHELRSLGESCALLANVTHARALEWRQLPPLLEQLQTKSLPDKGGRGRSHWSSALWTSGLYAYLLVFIYTNNAIYSGSLVSLKHALDSFLRNCWYLYGVLFMTQNFLTNEGLIALP